MPFRSVKSIYVICFPLLLLTMTTIDSQLEYLHSRINFAANSLFASSFRSDCLSGWKLLFFCLTSFYLLWAHVASLPRHVAGWPRKKVCIPAQEANQISAAPWSSPPICTVFLSFPSNKGYLSSISARDFLPFSSFTHGSSVSFFRLKLPHPYQWEISLTVHGDHCTERSKSRSSNHRTIWWR